MAKQYALSDESVIVVVGSGAGGGTIANELAQKGIDVVCLEAGSRLSLSDVVNDERVMDQRMGWHHERYGVRVWLCKTVGGTTMRWSAVCPRFLEHEFRARTVYGAMENTSLIDWPLTLEELEPYYDKAEAKMGVSGTNGLPPSAENNNFKVLKAGARRVGYKDVTTSHIAINSAAYDGRPACRQIGFCNEGCAIGAKWSTLYTEVPKAEQTDHFELRTGAMVVKINHDRSGKVSGVVYRDESGASQEQKARAVCVAGNVVETTRLLLLSESALFPNGLANSSGQLGKNYMRHLSNVVWGIMPGRVNGHRGHGSCPAGKNGRGQCGICWLCGCGRSNGAAAGAGQAHIPRHHRRPQLSAGRRAIPGTTALATNKDTFAGPRVTPCSCPQPI